MLVLFSGTAFAGDLTITAFGNVSALSPYVNTRTNQTIFNLTVVADADDITINGINITFTGTATVGNISNVSIFNSSTSGSLLGSNTTFNSTPIFVNFSTTGSSLVVRAGETRYLVVRYEIKSNAASRFTLGGNVSGVADIVANNTVVSNITLPVNSTSTPSQIQDLHANASISPKYVDTNVINQTFIYTITPTGSDTIKHVNLSLPSGYQLVNLTAILTGVSQPESVINVTASNSINVTFTTPTTQIIRLNFTVNTSSTPASSAAFIATIGDNNGNLSSVATDVINNQTNVTTKALANVANVVVSKAVAVVNGTDYWEFNFTVNITDQVAGLLQFKMTTWNDTATHYIAVSNSTLNLTTLRKDTDFNTTNKTAIRNDYVITDGLSYSTSETNKLVTVFLRQIIPSDAYIAQTWFTTYSILFRST
jgi:hypothetical protein